MKIGTKVKYAYNFTCLKQKTLQNRLLLDFSTKSKGFMVKSFSNIFIISVVCVGSAVSHDQDTQWKLKLHCYNYLQSFLAPEGALWTALDGGGGGRLKIYKCLTSFCITALRIW